MIFHILLNLFVKEFIQYQHFDSNISTIEDDNGCINYVPDIIINQPEPVEISLEAISSYYSCENNISCYGGNDGFINVTVTGGSGIGYNYIWTNQNGDEISYEEDPSELPAGTYSLIASDIENNDCSAIFEIELSEPLEEYFDF